MNYPIESKRSKKVLADLKSKKSGYWMNKREEVCLDLFKRAATGVPAYKQFLTDSNIDSRKINSWEDFQKVPSVNKENYLRKYPYADLFWGGKLDKSLVYTSTSGSTGDPFYFARWNELDWQNSVYVEQFVKQNYKSNQTPTLAIICFGMGIWIGGIINYKSFDVVANRCKLPLSVVTPGMNVKEIINILKNVSDKYKQIVFVGYPPFIKDLVDALREEKINLRNKNIKLFFAAEAISEDFRNYIANELNIKDVNKSIMNIYGSAELGAMAAETLASTVIKRKAYRNKKVFGDLFGQTEKTPTLAQFIPYFCNFEQVGEKILITGDNAMPLVRYDIGDNGGVHSYKEVSEVLTENNINLKELIKEKGLENIDSELPFVYVYERANLSASYYGLRVYAEWIKSPLYKGELNENLTGKFTLITKLDKSKNQYLEVNLELRQGKKKTKRLKEIIVKEITKSLLKHSSEYREIYKQLGKKATPEVILWPFGHELYFSTGIKQRWVKKD